MKKAESNQVVNNIFSLSIEKTFLIASLPFIGYLMGYLFQLGFYEYLEVPALLINVKIESILGAVIPSTILFMLIAPIIGIAFWSTPSSELSKKLTYYPLVLLVSLVVGILSIVIIYLWQQTFTIKTLSLLGLLMLLLLTILLPKLHFPKTKSFLESINLYNQKVKIDNDQLETKNNSEIKNSNFFIFNPESKIHSYGIFFGIILILCFISFLLGRDNASSKEKFLIYRDDIGSEYIIVGSYNQKLVSIMIDKGRNTTSQIKFLPNEGTNNLSYEFIGKVNVYKNEENNKGIKLLIE